MNIKGVIVRNEGEGVEGVLECWCQARIKESGLWKEQKKTKAENLLTSSVIRLHNIFLHGACGGHKKNVNMC